ncbi:MAG: biotin transporter BioY [Bacillota bacterium]|jgi:biotin transport system substrate-specific component
MRRQQTLTLTISALMVATMCILSLIAIPLPVSPIPITLQTAAVLLTTLILGPRKAFVVILIYLIIGCLGLPVFAGGKAGLGVIAGPSGGFLLGFMPAALLGGFIYNIKKTTSLKRAFLAAIIINVIIYACGITYFAIITDISLKAAFLTAGLPFIPGEIIKIIFFVPLAISITKSLQKQMPAYVKKQLP